MHTTNIKNLRPKIVPLLEKRKVASLQMTHGDGLGLNGGEVLKLIFDNRQSSASSKDGLNKKNNGKNNGKNDNLPSIVEKKIRYCICEQPLIELPMPLGSEYSQTNNSESSITFVCMRCGGVCEGEIGFNSGIRGRRRSSSCMSSLNDFDKKLNKKRKTDNNTYLPIIADPNRYSKAYLKGLHVAKFGRKTPSHWPEFLNQEITRSFSFSYITHTPRCLKEPGHCIHKKPIPRRAESEIKIHKHIFHDVNVNDYLEPVRFVRKEREFDENIFDDYD